MLAVARFEGGYPLLGVGDEGNKSGERVCSLCLRGVSGTGGEPLAIRSETRILCAGGTVMGEGLGLCGFDSCTLVAHADAPPFGRMSRLGLNGSGPLISRIAGGDPFARRVRSLGGETREERFVEDEAGRAKG